MAKLASQLEVGCLSQALCETPCLQPACLENASSRDDVFAAVALVGLRQLLGALQSSVSVGA